MSYEFAVGMKVVCVDDSGISATYGIRRGQEYCVSHTEREFISLVGVPPYEGDRSKWFKCRFLTLTSVQANYTKIEYKAMETFRKIAANPKIDIREDA